MYSCPSCFMMSYNPTGTRGSGCLQLNLVVFLLGLAAVRRKCKGPINTLSQLCELSDVVGFCFLMHPIRLLSP